MVLTFGSVARLAGLNGMRLSFAACSKEIAEIEKENKAIEIALGNANLYTDDPQKFDELTSKLATNKEALEEKENRWLELQIKAEELTT